MPMLQRSAQANGRKADVFAQLPIGQHDSAEHALAADGVSCTVCHQISDEKLGTRDSFNGGFVMLPTPDSGTRPIFGPFKIDRGRTMIMRSVSGFEQSEAMHIRQSEVCATCHTLYTEALGPDGRVIAALPEQMNYPEWQHSSFRDERSCQSCHMPAVEGMTRMASVLGDQREGLARHLFVGGNAFMLRMLNRYRGELGVAATSQELEATTQSTLRQLERDTARIAIARTDVSGATLAIDVDVVNLAGHKMPTGYPSRRAWLHLSVTDRQGRVVFESGAFDETGLIRGNDNDADPLRVEPHYDEIRAADQVQIYESVMADASGAVTTGLLQATRYVKDNRLLPRGFDKATASADIAVRGAALDDPTFTGGGDRVRYLVNAAPADGPFEIEVELRYQPIGFRWAQNLARYDAPELRRFVSYFNSMAASSSVVVARASQSIGANRN
jgi:cytochrome c551/c552